jgi:hypothetical protein
MGALNIKDPAVAAKARKLARLKGTSITAAVDQALEESLKKAAPKNAAEREAQQRRVDAIVKRFQARLKRGGPSLKQVMNSLYDENGLPK